MPRGKAPDKPLTMYRVYIDYEAAGVDTSYSTANKKIYENRAGVNQKIRAALDMGVHPKFIQVTSITGTWAPSDEYDAEASIIRTCEECGVPFDEPSDDCRRLRNVLKVNEARQRTLTANPNLSPRSKALHQPLERTHPELFVIDEVDLVG